MMANHGGRRALVAAAVAVAFAAGALAGPAAAREFEPGDDHGGHGHEVTIWTPAAPVWPATGVVVVDDHSMGFEPGDDHGMHFEPGDDHGRHFEPGDDQGWDD